MSALSTRRSSDAMSAGQPFRGVRISKFRHVYGQGARRENCYEGLRIGTSAHDSQLCAVNPKFLACIIEVAGGGAFQVIPLKWMGKVDYHFGRVSGHNGPVTDLKWNPFNDNVIASASDDSTIKMWHIADDMHKHNTTEWLIELCGHSRRISYIDWHPTTENVLASAALDHRILLWNVSSGECLVAIDCHADTIYSMAFNKCGSLLATTCKDHILRVVDPRTGEVVQQGHCHDGAKAAKVVFVGDEDKLLTTGANKASRRQVAVWDRNDLSQPLLLQEIDSSSGLLVPVYDQDLNIAYIAGKGDGNIRYYEITDTPPFLHYLSEYQSRFPQRGMGVMPKRGLNVTQCEVFRFYKVHATQPLVEPISFIVPRKSETFQTDLYPPTAGPTPAMTADEWMCGMDKNPVAVSLSTGFVPTTCKPVQVVKCGSGDGQLLITADRNNDRKFRFLSEVTKPDYREVTQREDYDDIKRLREVQDKLSERIAMRQSSESGDSSVGSPRQSATAFSHDDVYRHRTQSPSFPPPRSPGASSAPMTVRVPSTPSNSVASTHSPNKIRRTESPLPVPEVNGNTDNAVVRRSHSPLLGRVVERPSSVSGSVEPDATGSGASSAVRASSEQSRLPTPSARSKTVLKPTQMPSEKSDSVITRPGSIGPRPILPREQTATVKPFRVHSSQPRDPTPLASIRSASLGEHQQHLPPVAVPEPTISSTKDADVHKLYTAQCARVREMMAADEKKERRMAQLEMDVTTLTSKYEQVLIENKRQQDDIESLRYEIDWKDQRIVYLERQLGNAVASQQRDPPSSPEP